MFLARTRCCVSEIFGKFELEPQRAQRGDDGSQHAELILEQVTTPSDDAFRMKWTRPPAAPRVPRRRGREGALPRRRVRGRHQRRRRPRRAAALPRGARRARRDLPLPPRPRRALRARHVRRRARLLRRAQRRAARAAARVQALGARARRARRARAARVRGRALHRRRLRARGRGRRRAARRTAHRAVGARRALRARSRPAARGPRACGSAGGSARRARDAPCGSSGRPADECRARASCCGSRQFRPRGSRRAGPGGAPAADGLGGWLRRAPRPATRPAAAAPLLFEEPVATLRAQHARLAARARARRRSPTSSDAPRRRRRRRRRQAAGLPPAPRRALRRDPFFATMLEPRGGAAGRVPRGGRRAAAGRVRLPGERCFRGSRFMYCGATGGGARGGGDELGAELAPRCSACAHRLLAALVALCGSVLARRAPRAGACGQRQYGLRRLEHRHAVVARESPGVLASRRCAPRRGAGQPARARVRRDRAARSDFDPARRRDPARSTARAIPTATATTRAPTRPRSSRGSERNEDGSGCSTPSSRGSALAGRFTTAPPGYFALSERAPPG